jgi:transcriptional regulator with XRE-family HTH domain
MLDSRPPLGDVLALAQLLAVERAAGGSFYILHGSRILNVRRAGEHLQGGEAVAVNRYRNEGLSAWIGAAIHRLRELNGWSQYELADAARIARSYLSRIENGHKTPSIGVLEKIAAALPVPMSAFFDERVEFLPDGFGCELLYELMALEPQQRARCTCPSNHGGHRGACCGKVEDSSVKKEILGAMAENVHLNCRMRGPA